MFGMSVFQSVLERLKAEEDAEAETEVEQPSPYGVRGLGPGFVAGREQAAATGHALVHQAYFDTAGDEMMASAQPVAAPVMPDHLHRTRPQEIAEDLGLTDHETAATLTLKRRAFAGQNHPDRHHSEFRLPATTRMKIANMLIDEALRRISIMQRPG
ncbi:hypothetical protein P6U16_17945 [Rhizobium sp. 32-5/1]|uniref:hypothetical protein n=1 Tax=Rhizobium sp. 32-5/1 TaxID=3019602 RepID=UPI00240D154F|nr:hypothetical protein [Rhizobium sp. 32-5/1]WEZ82848.1 hypothetical protein P6U16_17945 [Rhizobium sp. 32-5/1]